MGVPSYVGLHKPTVSLLLTLPSGSTHCAAALRHAAAAAPPSPTGVPCSHRRSVFAPVELTRTVGGSGREGRAPPAPCERESQGRALRLPSPNLLCRAAVRIDQMVSRPGWWILSSDGEEEEGEEELRDPRGGRRMANGR
jgi:hypothetical protein